MKRIEICLAWSACTPNCYDAGKSNKKSFPPYNGFLIIFLDLKQLWIHRLIDNRSTSPMGLNLFVYLVRGPAYTLVSCNRFKDQ